MPTGVRRRDRLRHGQGPGRALRQARALLAAAADALRAPARFVREIGDHPPATPGPIPTGNGAPPAPGTPAPASKAATVATGTTPVPAPPAPVALAPATGATPAPATSARGRETVLADRPSTPPARAARKPLPPVVVAVAIVALAVVGFVAGRALTHDDAPATKELTAGPARLTVPVATKSTAVPGGLGLQGAHAYALDKATLIAGSGRPAGANLLPAGALAQAAAGKTPRVVDVGDAHALRFAGLRLKNRQATVLALLTKDGTQVLICEPECNSTLATAKLAVAALDVVPPAGYGTALQAALTTYEKDRAAADKALAKAKKAAAQASAARKLEAAAGTLATAVAKLDDHPAADQLRDRLAAGARDVKTAAAALATAAAHNKAAYAAARAKLAGADRGLRKDVAALSALRVGN